MKNCFQESASVGVGALLILCLMVIITPAQRNPEKRMNDATLRKEMAGRSDPWRQSDLEAVPADANLLGDEGAAANPGALAVVKVSMRNMRFSSGTLKIKKGTVVEWQNDDLVPHTVTSDSFDSGSLGPGKSWRHTFTKEGQFPYACTFHPAMTGVVVVK